MGVERGPIDLIRREFLARCCQGASAALIPTGLRRIGFTDFWSSSSDPQVSGASFHFHPHYRTERPLDATLLKVNPDLDDFVSEQYAAQIEKILERWSSGLMQSPPKTEAIENSFADGFLGTSPKPAESRQVRSDPALQVHENKFGSDAVLASRDFVRELRSSLSNASQVVTADFQITSIRATTGDSTSLPITSRLTLEVRVRYELVSTGRDYHREQRVGYWDLQWQASVSGGMLVHRWQWIHETQSRSTSPIYIDITAAALGGNSSYASQLLHGTDYWRTILDGACGIDIYGHNGVSVADIDNDGFDDLYICQPAGLPNRLYRNRCDGTFEDVTESSGLGLLENTACALFADFNNDGLQDVIVVRAKGPVLFLNEGNGKFREKADAFHFANLPQGTFTGAAVADYDRDGWLDIYFCLYGYYQGTGQYRYPSPYHDANNGPPNFMMRNNRDDMFSDVTAESGLNKNNTRFSFCCGWSDYNGDGWPDLYVVNDFGRKNLYRNNADGTFTDVAAQAGADDIGAGMSVCWFDYDNDRVQDLYVANMWTAAGERIAEQEQFQKNAPAEVRALYRKHAMGNSLYRNRGTTFENITESAGVGMGRWAWASDTFDFDHDGFSDLYAVNGMVSGPSRRDLNSFFWRQVVANSPSDAGTSPKYEEGWNAINELIRADGTWSGYERNVFYANNRDGTFSDVSAAVGLDFIQDGRAFAVADFDGDGRQEIFLKNRNAPQLRVLKNAIIDLPPSIAFRLVGRKSNRDAIGAMISIETELGRQTRMLQAGSGFLSQHSKEVMFGLGKAPGFVKASIRWPSGLVQELSDLLPNHRVWVEEGAASPSRIEAFRAHALKNEQLLSASQKETELLPDKVETWLLEPVSAPAFELFDLSGQSRTLEPLRGKPVLLSFWVTKSEDCQKDLEKFQQHYARWTTQGLQLVTVNLDDVDSPAKSHATARDQRYSFPVLRGTDDVTGIYNILYRQLFDRHRDLVLPTAFLINPEGEIVKVYQGSINPEHIEQDFRHIPQNDGERLAHALPFSGAGQTLEFGRNYLSCGALFFQRGYLDQAEVGFQRALRDDPSSAEAAYGIGSVYLRQDKNSAARASFERAIKLKASYPATMADAWNNIGVLATREEHAEESVRCFEEALNLNPHHLLALDNLGNAYRLQKRWDDARKVLERALEVASDDPEANYSLGMVFAQTDDNTHAYKYLQRALKARPVYPEALNNLGVLYLVTERTEQAVESFEKCIQVAPAFDQAYLNLARVYALQGARDKARTVLLELLKQHPGQLQGMEMMKQLKH
jgi:tetratricopeptide (TPR) repeat protein/peroxiredoxin